MSKIKIEIKNRWTGKILFEYEKEDNTIKDTLIEAVKNGADLRGADLGGADLGGAYLGGADLRGAKEIPFVPFACPSDGAFIGWKKVRNCLVQLEIPEDARRQSAIGTKCRCDKAKVLGIVDLETNESQERVTNNEYAPLDYIVGEMVYPDSFDDNRWDECSHGIHFFINKQEAINYIN